MRSLGIRPPAAHHSQTSISCQLPLQRVSPFQARLVKTFPQFQYLSPANLSNRNATQYFAALLRQSRRPLHYRRSKCSHLSLDVGYCWPDMGKRRKGRVRRRSRGRRAMSSSQTTHYTPPPSPPFHALPFTGRPASSDAIHPQRWAFILVSLAFCARNPALIYMDPINKLIESRC